ncbi:MAG: hypothetical protein H0V66_08295 [Bdellovibrionales bacterium]|nr:hypothetical protein [Bdellovibrionales bacterium]
MKLRFIPLLVTLMALPAMAQEVAMPQVAETVQEFITLNGHDMTKLQPSCPNFEACGHMSYHVKTYTFKGNAQKAFDLLISLKPYEIWDSSSRFEMEYDPASKSFLGKEHDLPPVSIGQVFFLELDITKGMQIPVAFQVVELDSVQKTLSFSYLKQNKSNGIQRITFEQDGENFKVIHETHYKSESKFRDKHLYGFFHTRLLDDVWESFEKRL